MSIKQRLQEKIKTWQQRVDLQSFLKPKNLSFLVFDLVILFLFFLSTTSILGLTIAPKLRTWPIISTLTSRLNPQQITEKVEFGFETDQEKPLEPEITPEILETPTPKPTGQSDNRETPTSNQTITPMATPTSRAPNPPIINISYPAEMQSIEMRSDQTLCLVDTPTGGNTSGLKRRHNLSETGWTAYADIFTLCFNPQEGLNRIQLQYRNSYGDESSTYTRQFNFHRLQNINITLSGNIYQDKNCNGTRDSEESNISTNASVYIWKPGYIQQANFQSNSDGTFSYSTNIVENESLTLFPSVVSPAGYKANPHYNTPSFTFDKNNRSSSVDYPQVPNESVGQCY